MSDPHDALDPVDRAYVQAEALLSDDAARAARRARVLGAIAHEAAAPAVASTPARRAWRSGGWLAAACVAGLATFFAIQIYRPPSFPPRTAPAAQTPAAQTPAAGGASASRRLPTPAPSPARQASASALRGAAPAPAAAPVDVPAAAPPPLVIAPPEAAPTAPAPPPPAIDVSADRRAAPAPEANSSGPLLGGARDEVDGSMRSSAARASGPPLAVSPAEAALARSELSARASPSAEAERLRAAAAAGRTAEVEALLDEGAPVDAADADGDTALMESIRADHPAAAAALRRHGASLDRQNRAGESARDMATTKGDAELNQAIGLGP
jgi:hypothetical protein